MLLTISGQPRRAGDFKFETDPVEALRCNGWLASGLNDLECIATLLDLMDDENDRKPKNHSIQKRTPRILIQRRNDD
jgi:hypothetical protein